MWAGKAKSVSFCLPDEGIAHMGTGLDHERGLMRSHALPKFATSLLACAAIGCSIPTAGDSHTDPANGTGNTNAWSFTMAASHNNFTIQQGATDTNIVTFTRVGGFTGPITLMAFSPDASIGISFEPITTTGAITTTRVLTAVPGPHGPILNLGYGLAATAASDQVMGQQLDITYSIVRKTGTFINAPASLSVGAGQSVLARISLIRTNYTANVPMTLFNAPSGVTATFSPNPVTDTVTQMTLSADASVVPGTYNIGVRDNEGTSFQGTAPVALTVTPPGTISLSTPINPLAVPKNASVPAGITIARTNYAGPVTITLSGVPAGVTTVFTSPVTGNTFSITFTNSSGVPGAYPIVITGSGPGLTDASVTLTVNIS
jgi:hypothetical protein